MHTWFQGFKSQRMLVHFTDTNFISKVLVPVCLLVLLHTNSWYITPFF